MRCLSESVLLSKDLDIPDGIAQSADGQWIAVSNHNEHTVRVYRNSISLSSSSEPNAILGRINYPHGLRFSACGQYILIADAGLPFVHIFTIVLAVHGIPAYLLLL